MKIIQHKWLYLLKACVIGQKLCIVLLYTISLGVHLIVENQNDVSGAFNPLITLQFT